MSKAKKGNYIREMSKKSKYYDLGVIFNKSLIKLCCTVWRKQWKRSQSRLNYMRTFEAESNFLRNSFQTTRITFGEQNEANLSELKCI